MTTSLVHADASLIKAFKRIQVNTEETTQTRANMMLARIAWARITEPGDGHAGALIEALGAEDALDLVLQRADTTRLAQALENMREHSGSVVAEHTMRGALERWRSRVDRAETVRDIERAAALGIQVVFPDDEHWPVSLNDLGVNAPTMLWVRGDWRALSAPSLGVVGARAATGYGSHVTAELVDGACAAGIVIVSGAAYGIDAVAHRTALAAGGATVAVLAGGVDRSYPKAHDTLLRDIKDSGAVCSEMVPGSAPTRWRFLQRNRLIAALSAAVLVTEAGVRSGSLNTAGHASQLSRPIGAVPGPITSAASAGCHRMVRDYDATLITSVNELYELLAVDRGRTLFGDSESADDVETSSDGAGAVSRQGSWARRVVDAIPLRGFRTLAGIAQFSGLNMRQVRDTLAELELLGQVRSREGVEGEKQEWALVK
ncbi:DNA-processing protein DprA [Leucobacter sp. UT-8R-CII-1-4]|uniref:DNA-processing protein DprA n=1 Tax=Leucobacter sp. UT-8R-CII-1-4 TaxID=3040075 RepID=UPI0024A9A284|nr:DNA-processing protein DprA [Leucobacter sp. UT-8R-CII-1-4]MDI6023074.1 DNA-processing protein DprA [Leucobacter sp. UT-8R-CII-1-4]